MLIKNIPYLSLIIITLISRVFIVISSNNWLFIWVGLELNLLSFIPLMSSTNNLETESMVKYFLTQAIASVLLFISLIYINLSNYVYISIFFIFVSLLLKLGAAPCHFWFPIVINSLNWLNCLILSTIQKLSPLILLSIIFSSIDVKLILPVIIFNSFVGGMGGINQTQIRPLIAYSSIVHMAWIICLCYLSIPILWIYLLIYFIILSSLITTFFSFNSWRTSKFNIKKNKSFSIVIISFLGLLSLAGLPPLLGFLPKWMRIYIISHRGQITIIFILIIGTLLSLFYYLRIFFIIFTNSIKSNPEKYINSYNYFFLIISCFSLIIALSINIIYAMIIFNKS